MANENALPLWMTGRHVSSVTARFQLPNSAGAFPPAAGAVAGPIQVLTGFFDEIDLNGENSTQNVVAATSTLENYVPYEIDDSYTITEIMRSVSGLQSGVGPYGGGNFLTELWYNASSADQILITVTRGTNAFGPGNTWTGYLVMLDYSETIRKPKSTIQMVCRMISLANVTTGAFPQPNPTYT